jgi:hypothetical protein
MYQCRKEPITGTYHTTLATRGSHISNGRLNLSANTLTPSDSMTLILYSTGARSTPKKERINVNKQPLSCIKTHP